MNRFFLSKFTKHITDKDTVHQISRVLRMKPGEQIIVCLNDGFDNLFEIIDIGKDHVDLKWLAKEKNNNELSFQLNVYFGLIKHPKRISFLIEKCTELGASSFIPLICGRSQVKDLKKEEHLKEVIRESCEQCERAIMPVISKPISFEDMELSGLTAMPAINVEAKKISDLNIDTESEINLIIGPEGGFSEDEIRIAQEKGYFLIDLGPRILRSETAAIACCSMISAL